MYGAIISALVNVGFDVYKQFGSTSPQARAGQYGNQLKQTALRYLQPFTGSDYWNLPISEMAGQSLNYGYANAPQLNQFNMDQLQKMLGQALPGYQQMLGQATTNTQALLRGEIPQDVLGQVRTNAAQSAITGGFAGSPAATTLTARDLGLTSLNLESTGQQQMTSLIGTARNYLMPQMVNPTSLLPLSDLIGGAEWSKASTFQANQSMYTAMANAISAQYGAPASLQGAGLGGDIGGAISALTTKNAQGQSPLSSIMNMFGGGGSGVAGISSIGANVGSGGSGSYTPVTFSGG
jgi:hypothetical protein